MAEEPTIFVVFLAALFNAWETRKSIRANTVTKSRQEYIDRFRADAAKLGALHLNAALDVVVSGVLTHEHILEINQLHWKLELSPPSVKLDEHRELVTLNDHIIEKIRNASNIPRNSQELRQRAVLGIDDLQVKTKVLVRCILKAEAELVAKGL